jgi:hypothetical protein
VAPALPEFRHLRALRPRGLRESDAKRREHCAGVLRARQVQRVGRRQFRRVIPDQKFREREIPRAVAHPVALCAKDLEFADSFVGLRTRIALGAKLPRDDGAHFQIREVAYDDRCAEASYQRPGIGECALTMMIDTTTGASK